jgi:two-component system, NtrC family, sensor kinase
MLLPADPRAARLATIRLLQLSVVAALVLPAILFAYASWVSHGNTIALADERIVRSLDVLQEQALKVFQSIEATLNTVEELFADRSNAQIQSDATRMHDRLKRIASALPEIQSIWIFDQAGRALVTTLANPPPPDDFSQRDYFRAQVNGGERRFIGSVQPSPFGGRPFFAVSRARLAPGKTFAGVLEVSVLPSDLYRFYATIVSSVGLQYALIREDGAMLVRYPQATGISTRLDERSGFGRTVAANPQGGMYTVHSQVDNIERRFGVRKLPGFPLYVSAGIETASIRGAWIGAMAPHLIFGVPATLLLAGSLFMIMVRTKRLHDEQDRREAAEDILRQTQKMEAVGQLTGGIAHDFNNLLTIIIGNLENAERQLAAWSEGAPVKLHQAVGNAMKGARRAATLTQRLLAFSRQAPHKPERIDSNKLISGLSELLSRSLRENIALEVVGAAGLWSCEADRAELEGALVNLAVNARDAMPDGGKLTIETSNAYLDDAYCRNHPEVAPGQYVLIAVTDTGSGMTRQIIERAFDPFFTTKPPGQGTGLGLSQVYGFAKQSGGHLKIYSEPNEGTTVKLYLPRIMGEGVAEEQSGQNVVTGGDGEVVLVVEDDADVRGYVVETLRALHYRVRHAPNGERALQMVDGQPIDLLLTDVVLPGMNGRRLAEEITARQPAIKVVYMTGYSRNAIVHQGRLDPGLEMLQKPLTSSDLSSKIRKVLGSKN